MIDFILLMLAAAVGSGIASLYAARRPDRGWFVEPSGSYRIPTTKGLRLEMLGDIVRMDRYDAMLAYIAAVHDSDRSEGIASMLQADDFHSVLQDFLKNHEKSESVVNDLMRIMKNPVSPSILTIEPDNLRAELWTLRIVRKSKNRHWHGEDLVELIHRASIDGPTFHATYERKKL